MAQPKTVPEGDWYLSSTRVLALAVTLSLLVPFMALALLPMMLFLIPVAIVGLPFLIPAFVSGTLATRSDSKRVLTLRPLLVVRPTVSRADH